MSDRTNTLPCARCGRPTHIDQLDAKPSRKTRWQSVLWFFGLNWLAHAADHGADFDRLECRRCYGPDWVQGGGGE